MEFGLVLPEDGVRGHRNAWERRHIYELL